MIGYDDMSKAYRVYNPQVKKILVVKDLVFHESIIGDFLLSEKSSVQVKDDIVIPLALESSKDKPDISGEVVAREDHEHIPANVVAATTRGER